MSVRGRILKGLLGAGKGIRRGLSGAGKSFNKLRKSKFGKRFGRSAKRAGKDFRGFVSRGFKRKPKPTRFQRFGSFVSKSNRSLKRKGRKFLKNNPKFIGRAKKAGIGAAGVGITGGAFQLGRRTVRRSGSRR